MKLRLYKRDELVTETQTRLRNSPTLLQEVDITNIINNSVMFFSSSITTPRYIAISGNTGTDITLPNDVESINRVIFPAETGMVNLFRGTIDLIPLLQGNRRTMDFENLQMWLLTLDTLTMISAYFDGGNWWEWVPPILKLTKSYESLFVEYLPFLDETADEWYLFNDEIMFLKDHVFNSAMVRNSQSLVNAQYIGVGNEYASVLEYWNAQLAALEDNWAKKALVMWGE